MIFWVARNRIGFIYLYSIEPIKRDGYFQERRGCETMCLPKKKHFPKYTLKTTHKKLNLNW